MARLRLIQGIQKVKKLIIKNEELYCTCDDRAFQINQGCECEKGINKKILQIRLNRLIEKI